MERQMLLLARELSRRGLRVAMVVNAVGEREPGAAAGLTLVERGPRGSARGLRGTASECAQVRRALRDADGSVVVVAGGTPVLGFIAAYCRVRRRKLVFAAASDLDFEVGEPQKVRRRRGLYRAGVRLSDAVVVLTGHQASLARRAFPRLRHDQLLKIPYFAVEANGVADGPAVEFLWAGRMHDVKRPLLFADLAAELPEAAFGLVGLVPPNPTPAIAAYVERLDEAAAELPNLELVGPLPHEKLQERLAHAVALVNTSTHEGMPNTFLEAWSLGVPVLTLAVDPDGLIEEHDLGVAAGGSWERFVAGARELWAGRADRAALSQRTRRFVHDVHSPEAVGARWQELLERLTADRAAATPTVEARES
jgi:glycosyltransferase involved in cell wall biosynthesis